MDEKNSLNSTKDWNMDEVKFLLLMLSSNAFHALEELLKATEVTWNCTYKIFVIAFMCGDVL